jgi:hypothetical protein
MADRVLPVCPWCKHVLDPKKDVLFENTGQLSASGVDVIYCRFCGAVLGGAQFTVFSKRANRVE